MTQTKNWGKISDENFYLKVR